jgi:hypothetical protein
MCDPPLEFRMVRMAYPLGWQATQLLPPCDGIGPPHCALRVHRPCRLTEGAQFPISFQIMPVVMKSDTAKYRFWNASAGPEPMATLGCWGLIYPGAAHPSGHVRCRCSDQMPILANMGGLTTKQEGAPSAPHEPAAGGQGGGR